jgi:YD repeat-containing protein
MVSTRRHFVPNPVQGHYRTKPGAMRRTPLSIHTGYDAFGNEIGQSLPDPANGTQDSGSPTTTCTYDVDGNNLSLTDPDGSTDGTVATTTANYSYQYDAAGDLTQSVDADGQVIQYQYDAAGQEILETWYPTLDDGGGKGVRNEWHCR